MTYGKLKFKNNLDHHEHIGLDKQLFDKVVNIILTISFNICFGCLEELSAYVLAAK